MEFAPSRSKTPKEQVVTSMTRTPDTHPSTGAAPIDLKPLQWRCPGCHRHLEMRGRDYCCPVTRSWQTGDTGQSKAAPLRIGLWAERERATLACFHLRAHPAHAIQVIIAGSMNCLRRGAV